MTKTWLCLILALNSVLAFGAGPLELEPARGYVYAEDRIPDFKTERKADESFILDPVPKDWVKLPLDGEWKILLKRIDGFVDYFNLEPNYGVDDMAQLLKPGYDFNAWKNVYVPLPLGQIKDNGYTYGAKKPGYIACYQRVARVAVSAKLERPRARPRRRHRGRTSGLQKVKRVCRRQRACIGDPHGRRILKHEAERGRERCAGENGRPLCSRCRSTSADLVQPSSARVLERRVELAAIDGSEPRRTTPFQRDSQASTFPACWLYSKSSHRQSNQ